MNRLVELQEIIDKIDVKINTLNEKKRIFRAELTELQVVSRVNSRERVVDIIKQNHWVIRFCNNVKLTVLAKEANVSYALARTVFNDYIKPALKPHSATWSNAPIQLLQFNFEDIIYINFYEYKLLAVQCNVIDY